MLGFGARAIDLPNPAKDHGEGVAYRKVIHTKKISKWIYSPATVHRHP